jgi:hypothetical protein
MTLDYSPSLRPDLNQPLPGSLVGSESLAPRIGVQPAKGQDRAVRWSMSLFVRKALAEGPSETQNAISTITPIDAVTHYWQVWSAKSPVSRLRGPASTADTLGMTYERGAREIWASKARVRDPAMIRSGDLAEVKDRAPPARCCSLEPQSSHANSSRTDWRMGLKKKNALQGKFLVVLASDPK